jgi:hypothetical protein
MFNIYFFRKSRCLQDNVKKPGIARQDTGDNITWRMPFSCWIRKAKDTQSE